MKGVKGLRLKPLRLTNKDLESFKEVEEYEIPVTSPRVSAMSYRIQETVTCTNCSTAVHADNYILHLSFCSKFISKCPVCQKSILNSDMNSHIHGSQEYIRLAAITNDLTALREMAEHGH